jgi:DNA-binding transcriptional MerR regulator
MADKKYSIGEVEKKLELRSSVLRYWETVFDELSPYKTPGGTRRYSEQDVALISLIRDLLYSRKFTIAGAKRYLKDGGVPADIPDESLAEGNGTDLQEIILELESILADLKNS